MGCGQSKKIHLYPRKNKSKSNGKKGHDDGTEDDDEEHTEGREKHDQQQKEKEKIDEELQQSSEGNSPEPNSNEVIIPILKKNGPLLQSQDISSSQQNFFKMLDQKIEQGPDYDSNSETEIAIEEARLNSLVQHWESASLSASMCSSTSRSLQNTPVRHASLNSRQSQIRSQFQQPLSAELLSQQQQMIKQLQQHQANQTASINSPKRVELNANNRQQLLTQTIIHQTYGVQPQPSLPQAHILAQYQNQQQTTLSSNMQLRQLSASSVIPSNYSPPIPGATTNVANPNRNLACLQMSYYSQTPHFSDAIHSPQVQQIQSEPRFPPAISVNRLAPQVQRQLRETQELIKDCTPLYGTYQPAINSPGSSTATQIQIRSQTRTGLRRPTLETQYSQEL
ncbi:CLUMA_CG009409, isoform A, partial [Clunio marinus]